MPHCDVLDVSGTHTFRAYAPVLHHAALSADAHTTEGNAPILSNSLLPAAKEATQQCFNAGCPSRMTAINRRITLVKGNNLKPPRTPTKNSTFQDDTQRYRAYGRAGANSSSSVRVRCRRVISARPPRGRRRTTTSYLKQASKPYTIVSAHCPPEVET